MAIPRSRETSGPTSLEALQIIENVASTHSADNAVNGSESPPPPTDSIDSSRAATLISVPEYHQLEAKEFQQCDPAGEALPAQGAVTPISVMDRTSAREDDAAVTTNGLSQSSRSAQAQNLLARSREISSSSSTSSESARSTRHPDSSSNGASRRSSNPTADVFSGDRREQGVSDATSASASSRRSSTRRTNSSSGRPADYAKPLPGVPTNEEREDLTTLSPSGLNAAVLPSQSTPPVTGAIDIPPQHIPRRVSIPRSGTDDLSDPGSARRVSPLVSGNVTPTSKPGGNANASPFSPIDPDPVRTLADSNRSSIDDIRRNHAARSAAAATGPISAGPQASDASTRSQIMPRAGHKTDQPRPTSVLETRQARQDAVQRHTSVHSSARTEAEPDGEVINDGASSFGGSVTDNIPGMESARERARLQREGEREKASAKEGERSERDKERGDAASSSRDRERRSRRTLGDYALGKTLGAGSMGKVKLGVRMGNGDKVAIKIIPRHTSVAAAYHASKPASTPEPNANGAAKAQAAPPTPSFLAKAAAKDASKEIRTIREGSLQLLLHHPYVCGMREMMIHPNHYYMIFEYVNGGQMLDYIISHGRLRERAARKFARQIGSALLYCHFNSIVHRDLKIENILISKTGNIKIIDFGLSNLFSPHSHLSTFCGSLYFAAPELLNAKVYTGPEVDVWSFGIVLYVLVCGKVPFDDQSMPALHAKIKRGLVEYPAWLSGECKHILSRMLVTNPAQRATLQDTLSHPWMVKGYDGPPNAHMPQREPLRPGELNPEVIKGMTGFEFGTPEDIEARLLEVLTSENYLHALHNWESRHRGVTKAASFSSQAGTSSTSLEAPSSSSRSNARSSPESKTKSASKRFSGIDFYRKKISGNGLFSGSSNGKEDGSANGSVNGSTTNGVGANGPGSSEPLDPTRGFHPLISIYYLVSEKMERERLYGHSFFASSSLSVSGQAGTATAGARQTAAAAASSSMPTSADIPQQEALRVPEVSHVSHRGYDRSPVVPAVAARPVSTLAEPPTPVFESRSKSRPMSVMVGQPRARANGDEVEAAMRDQGYGTGSKWAQQAPSTGAAALGAPPSATPPVANNHRRSLSLTARRTNLSNAGDASGRGGGNDNRRSVHIASGVPSQEDTLSGSDTSPASGAFGSSLVRRFGSLMTRSPSTPLDAESREKRRMARMSTGGMPVPPATGMPGGRRGSLHVPGSGAGPAGGSLTGVEEGKDEEQAIASTPIQAAEAVRRSNYSSVGRAAGSPARKGSLMSAVNKNQPPIPIEEQQQQQSDWQGNNAQAGAVADASPNKTRDPMSSKPIFLKGLFSVQTTSTRPRKVIHADLVRVLERIGVQYREIQGGYECVHLPSLDFTGGAQGDISTAAMGQGNARIPFIDASQVNGSGGAETPVVTGSVDPNQAQRNQPRRKPSRISFTSSKRESSKARREGSVVGGEAGDDSASEVMSRSRASSMTAGTHEQADAQSAAGRPITPRSSRTRNDSLVQTQQRNPSSSPVLSHSSELPPVPDKDSRALSPTSTFVGAGTPGAISQPAPASRKMDSSAAQELAVRFEVFVVKVPLLLGVNGLQFRRVAGNPWQYQMLAKRVLQELKL